MSLLDVLRQRLLPASFRGVPFKVRYHERLGGRRVQVTEFPLLDVPEIRDMGGRAGSFRIAAYVLGENYMAARDALQAALDRAGPGALVHPYLGELQVQIGDVSSTETEEEGGICRWVIDCWQGSNIAYPVTAVDTQARVQARVVIAADASAAAAAESIDAESQPDFVLSAATDRVQEATRALVGLTQRITMLPAEAVALSDALNSLSHSAASLVLTPASLAAQIRTALRQIADAAVRPLDAFEQLQDLFGFGDDWAPPATQTPARLQEVQNQVAIAQLVRQMATIEACRVASILDYASYDDALATRNLLNDQLDAIAGDVASDELYHALSGVREATLRDISTRGADLAHLVRLRLAEDMPALDLAWSLYGDAERADELVARNRLRNPLFVPGGVDLEALDA